MSIRMDMETDKYVHTYSHSHTQFKTLNIIHIQSV